MSVFIRFLALLRSRFGLAALAWLLQWVAARSRKAPEMLSGTTEQPGTAIASSDDRPQRPNERQ